MDASGKDGVIEELGFGPPPREPIRIAKFKAPTEAEARRDFLWRIHAQVPTAAEIVVFNRSHYEDLVEPRLSGTLAPDAWDRRCDHVNWFERMLADEGTLLVKIFLHVGKAVQAQRLERRMAEPGLHHLVNPDDHGRNERWHAYAAVYREVITRTNTSFAPWHVVPADDPLERNLQVCRSLVERFAALR